MQVVQLLWIWHKHLDRGDLGSTPIPRKHHETTTRVWRCVKVKTWKLPMIGYELTKCCSSPLLPHGALQCLTDTSPKFSTCSWLVVSTLLNIISQLGWLLQRCGKMKHVPVTTNQVEINRDQPVFSKTNCLHGSPTDSARGSVVHHLSGAHQDSLTGNLLEVAHRPQVSLKLVTKSQLFQAFGQLNFQALVEFMAKGQTPQAARQLQLQTLVELITEDETFETWDLAKQSFLLGNYWANRHPNKSKRPSGKWSESKGWLK